MMPRYVIFRTLCLSQVWAWCAIASMAQAHGIAGNRYFPGTLTFDDPAVADEFIAPNFSTATLPVGPGDTVNDTTYAFSFARLLTPDLVFQLDSGWTQWTRASQPRQEGFDTTNLGFKARIYEDDPHETLVSISLGWGLPNSGRSTVGQSGPSTLQTGLFFGKGFGDLPNRWRWLRPFGVAGGLLAELPTHRHSTALSLNPSTGQLEVTTSGNPNVLHWGFALEYSTLYLTDRFNGGPPKEEPLHQWVLLVEFAFDTPLGASLGRKRTGTANPGLSYVALTWQVAVEAIVPLDRGAGSGVGGRFQLLLFLDDLLPSVFGKPLLSEHPLFAPLSR
jgi:hypothetical protein